MTSRRHSTFSDRFLLSFLVILTVLLLAGSAILQRIVFKADQVSTAVFLSPATVNTSTQTEFGSSWRADFSALATVVTVQLELTYDPALLELTQAIPTEQWQTKTFSQTGGELRWVLVPTESEGLSVKVRGIVEFGKLTFKSLGDGLVTLQLSQANTQIAALDPDDGFRPYNAVSSVQNSVVTIGGTLAAGENIQLDQAETTAPVGETVEETTVGGPQRLLSQELMIGPDSVLAFIRLQYASPLKIQFGQTRALGSVVEATSLSRFQVVRLSGLTPGTAYFYQVTVDSPEKTSHLTSRLQSFQTNGVSDGPVVAATSQLALAAGIAKKSVLLYASPRDAAGNTVTSAPLMAKIVSGSASTTPFIDSGGHQQTAITSELAGAQKVRVQVFHQTTLLGERTIAFDPNLAELQPESAASLAPFQPSRTITLALAGIGLLILLLGWLFIRLARAK